MPSEGIVYRSGKKKPLQKKQSKVSLADQIAQKRARGISSTNYSARSGKSNKTGSDLDSVDISHLTKNDVKSPTPLPTVNPNNAGYRTQPQQFPSNTSKGPAQPPGNETKHTKPMPYQNSRHVLPPVPSNRPPDNNQYRSTKNHGVTLPPISDSNSITGGNHDRREQYEYPTKNNNYDKRQDDPNNNELNKYQDRGDKKERDRSHERRDSRRNDSRDKRRESAHEKRPRSKDERNRRRSRSHAKVISDSRRRSRSRERERHRSKSREHERNRQSRSRDRKDRRRSNSRDRKDRRRSISRDRKDRRRSMSRDRKDRRRSSSYDRKKSRSSRERRHSSYDNDKKRHSESRERNHRRHSRERSESRDVKRNRRSRSRDRKNTRNRGQSSERHSRKEKHRSRELSKDRYKREKSERHRGVRSCSLDSHSSGKYTRSEKRNHKRHNESFGKENRRTRDQRSKSNHKHHYFDDDSSDSDYEDSPTKYISPKKEKVLLDRSEIRYLKSNNKRHKRKEMQRLENEKKVNIIVVNDGSDDSSSDIEDQHSNRTIVLRSKSQHAKPIHGKHRNKFREYSSDIESNNVRGNVNRVVVYDEARDILIPANNRLNIPRAFEPIENVRSLPPRVIQQVEQRPSNQSEETLFYLVPANQNNIQNSNANPGVVHTDRRVVRMARAPEPETKVYYENSNDVVYGQEPMYDEYRQPIQQKFYNQHTNHYRHDQRSNRFINRAENVENKSTVNETTHPVKNQSRRSPVRQRSPRYVSEDQTNTGPEINITDLQSRQKSRLTPDGESSSSVGQTPSTSDGNCSRISNDRASTAEKRRALKHLNEISNYNINMALGKPSPRSPPLTDETLIKKVFNAEFQAEMDEFLKP